MKRITAMLLALLMLWEMIPSIALAEETYYGVGEGSTYHTVLFKDADGSALKEQFVLHGESATAPDEPGPISGEDGMLHSFSGWNRAPSGDGLKNITANTTFTAQYADGIFDNSVSRTDYGSVIDITIAPMQVDVQSDGVTPRVPAGVDVLAGALKPGHQVRATFAFDTFVPGHAAFNKNYIHYSVNTPLEQVILPCSGTTKVTSYQIVDTLNGDADVTDQYEVALQTGSYFVGRMLITVRMDAHQVYTGKPEYGVLAPSPVHVGGTLRPGDYLISYTGYFYVMPAYKTMIPTDVGDYIGYIDSRGAKIFDADHVQVHNYIYTITMSNPGDLYIEPRSIAITVQDVVDHVYDGKAVTPEVAYEACDEAALRGLLTNLGQTATATLDQQPVNVGTYTVGVQSIAFKEGSKDIPSKNYKPEITKGNVNIVARPLSVFVPQVSEDQASAAYQITDGSLAEGETLTVSIASGVATAQVMRGTADVTDNYDLTLIAEPLISSFETLAGQTYHGTFASGTDAGAYTFTMGNGQHGAVTTDGNTFTYTPEAGFVGQDMLQYGVAYGTGAQAAEMPLEVTVLQVNSAPAFVEAGAGYTAQGNVLTRTVTFNKDSSPSARTGTITGTDAETPGNQLVFAVTHKTENADKLGTLTLAAPDANGKVAYSFMPVKNAFGTATYTISLTDLGAPSGSPAANAEAAPKAAEKTVQLTFVVEKVNASPALADNVKLLAGPAGGFSDQPGFNTATVTWDAATDWETATEDIVYTIQYNVTNTDDNTSGVWQNLATGVQGVSGGVVSKTITWPQEGINTNTVWVRVIATDDANFGLDIHGNPATPAFDPKGPKSTGGRRSSKLKMDNAPPQASYLVTLGNPTSIKLTVSDAATPGAMGLPAACVTAVSQGITRIDDKNYTVAQGGDYTFQVTDKVGNTGTVTVPVPYINSAPTFVVASGDDATGATIQRSITNIIKDSDPWLHTYALAGTDVETPASQLRYAVTDKSANADKLGTLTLSAPDESGKVSYTFMPAKNEFGKATYTISLTDLGAPSGNPAANLEAAPKSADKPLELTFDVQPSNAAPYMAPSATMTAGPAGIFSDNAGYNTATLTWNNGTDWESPPEHLFYNIEYNVTDTDSNYTGVWQPLVSDLPGVVGVNTTTITWPKNGVNTNTLWVRVITKDDGYLGVDIDGNEANPAFTGLDGKTSGGRRTAKMKMDNAAPVVTYKVTPQAAAFVRQATIALTAADANQPGMAGLDANCVTAPQNATRVNDKTYTVAANGTYTFAVTDKVGNITTVDVTVDCIQEPTVIEAQLDARVVYNGQPRDGQEGAAYKVVSGQLADGHAFDPTDLYGYYVPDPPVNAGTYTKRINITGAMIIDTNNKNAEVNDHYIINLDWGDLTIDKRPVTVTIGSLNKKIGDADPAYTVTIEQGDATGDRGVLPEDLAAFEAFYQAAGNVYRTDGAETVGTKPGALTAKPISGMDNYDVTVVNGDVVIGKIPLTIRYDAHMVYNGTSRDGSLSPTIVIQDGTGPLRPGHAFAASYSGWGGAHRTDAGVYPNIIALTGVKIIDKNNGNAVVSDQYQQTIERPGDMYIAQRPIQVTLTAPAARVYNGQPLLPTVAFGAENTTAQTGLLTSAGHVATATLTAQPVNAGTHSVGVSDVLIQDGGKNHVTASYDWTVNTASVVIGKRPVTVTVHAASKTYGQADPAFSVDIEQDDESSDRGVLPADRAAFEAFYEAQGNVFRTSGDETTGTQTGALTATPYTDNDNYQVTVVAGDFTIAGIPITVRVDSHMTYDGLPRDGSSYPTYVVTQGQLRDGDAFRDILLMQDYTVDPLKVEAGDYPRALDVQRMRIHDSTGKEVTDQVYDVTIERPGDIYLARRPLDVVVEQTADAVYNGQPVVPAITFEAQDTEGFRGLLTSLGHTGSAAPNITPVDAGEYTVSPADIAISDASEADQTANYAPSPVSATVRITARPVTVTVKPSAKMFGQADPPFTVHIEQASAANERGVLPEDLAAFENFYRIAGKVYRTGTQENAGFYPGVLKAVAYAGNANYAVTVVPGDFVIQPLTAITVKPDQVNRVYSGNSHSVVTGDASVVSGALENGHTLATGVAMTATGTDVGDYPVALSAADVRVMDGEYDVTYLYDITTQPGVLRVAPRPIHIHAIDMGTKPYIGNAYALNATSGANKAVDVEAVNGDRGLISGATATMTASTTGAATTATDAGTYPIAVTGATILKDLVDITANFAIDYGTSGQLVIAPRQVTVTGDAQSKYERTADPAFTASFDSAPAHPASSGTGVLPQDEAAFTQFYRVTNLSTRANAGVEAVGAYAGVIVPPVYTANPNYAVTTVAGDFAILARVPLTIRPLSQTLTYRNAEQIVAFDQDDPDWVNRVSVTGLAAGDRISAITVSASGTDAGTYPLEVSDVGITDADGHDVTGRYDLTIAEAYLTIAPRPVLVQGVSGSWMYDAQYHARAVEIGTLADADSGLAPGHALGEVTLAETEEIMHAGTHSVTPISAAIVTLGGQPVAPGNYDIRYQAGSVIVAPRPVSVTVAKSEALPYGAKIGKSVIGPGNGYNAQYGVTIDGLMGDDYIEVYFNWGLPTEAKAVVMTGTYYGTVELVPCNAIEQVINREDYLINFQGEAYTEGEVPCPELVTTIAPRGMRFVAARSVVYDGQPHALKASDYAENRAFGSADSDYLLTAYQALTLADAALVGGTDANTYTYSERNTGASKVLVTKATDGLTVGQDVTGGYDYSITGALTIAKRPVAIAVISEAVPFTSAAHTPRTAAQPIAGNAHSGLPSGFTYAVNFTGDNAPTDPGAHAITLTEDMVTIYDASGNPAADNFSLTLTGGTLTIGDPTVLSIALDPVTVTYDGAEHTADEAWVVPTGLKPGHSIASVSVSGAGTNANTAAIPSYAIQASDAVITDGTNDVTGEYTISYPASTLVIQPRAVTLTADTLAPVVYDAQEHSAGYSVAAATANTGLVSGHSVSDITLTGGTQRDVGGYPVVPSAATITDEQTDVTANYDISYENGGITIDARPLTVALNDPSDYAAAPLYGDAEYTGHRALGAAAFTIDGLQGDDRFAEIGLDYGNTAQVGDKTLTIYHTGLVSGANRAVSGNYDIRVTQPTIAYTVLPRTLTYTATKTVTYDARPHSITDSEFVLTGGDGLANGETVSIATAVNVPQTGAGTYPYALTIRGAQAQTGTNVRILKNGADVTGNYVMQFHAALTIAQRPVTFALIGQSFPYDTAPHSLGYSVSATGQGTGLVAGHTETLAFASNSRTLPGQQSAAITDVRIHAGQEDVTANYAYQTSGAQLIIGAQPVVSLKPTQSALVYNGQMQAAPVTALAVTAGALRAGDAVASFTVSGQGLLAGNYANLPGNIVIRDNNGTGKDVTAYYALTPVAGTFTIQQRPVTVRIESVRTDYDATEHTATYRVATADAVSGLVGDDALTTTLVNASRTEIGAHPVTFAQDATSIESPTHGDVTDSYAISEIEGSIELTRPMQQYTVAYYYNGVQDASKTAIFTNIPYGTVISGYAAKPVTGYVLGSVVYGGSTANTSLTLGLDNAANMIRVYYVPMRNMAYTVSYVLRGVDGSALGTIQATKTVRDQALRTFDRVPYYDDASQVAPADRFYEIAPTISGYTYVPSGGGSIQIAADETRNQIVYYYRKNVTITANNDTRVYNGQAQGSTKGLTVTGLPTGWQLSGVTAVGEGNAVNTYTLSPSQTASIVNPSAPHAVAPDCRFSYMVGTLTITNRPVSVSIPTVVYDYDGAAHTVAPVVTGLADGHTLSAPLLDATRTMPGNNPVTFATGANAPKILAGGTDVTANYTPTFTSGSITVNARSPQVTLTARGITNVYNGSMQSGNGVTASGLAPGDHVKSVTVSGGGRTVGSYPLTPSDARIFSSAGVDVTRNYPLITYTNGSLSITQRPLTISVQSASYPYDGTAHSVTYAVEGSLASGDQLTNVVLSGNTRTDVGGNAVTVGAVTIQSGTENTSGNYALTKNDGNIAITQRNNLQYRVEYYLGGIRQDDMTEYYSGLMLGTPINAYPNKLRAGYALSKVLYGTGITNSLTIGLQSADNVIRVFYEPTGGQSYTIEYYVANLAGDGYSKISQDVVGGMTTGATVTDISQRIEATQIGGIVYARTEGLPLTITGTPGSNVIRVYYARRTTMRYRVEYYYDGDLNSGMTESYGQQMYGQVIYNYHDKVVGGYKLVRTENLPLTLGEDEQLNVIRVYYEKIGGGEKLSLIEDVAVPLSAGVGGLNAGETKD